jgi:hypothetical protein
MALELERIEHGSTPALWVSKVRFRHPLWPD